LVRWFVRSFFRLLIFFFFFSDVSCALLDIEEKEVNLRLHSKIGVLYVAPGQTEENAMFQNEAGSGQFNRFLSVLGDTIALSGWKMYRGGLDVKANTTGTHSVYRMKDGIEVMYHVATMLPNQKDDEQRVEKKRHLGNDVVVIIFKEGNQKFDPLVLTSHFNHVFIVVQNEGNKYR
jgi:hypothetical protein